MDSTSTGRAGRAEEGDGRTTVLRTLVGRLMAHIRPWTTNPPARRPSARDDTARGLVGPGATWRMTKPTQYIGVLPPDLWPDLRKETR